MIDVNKISGNRIDKSHIFHSHGMSRALQGSALGTVSAETFARRQAIDASRAHVGNYRQANIHVAPRVPIRPFSTGMRADVTPPSGPTHSFHDASRRHYDPYAH